MNQGDDLSDQEAAGDGAECGLSILDQNFEIEGEFEKAPRSPREEAIVRDALPYLKRTVAKHCDYRCQNHGPAPSDLGEHKPIPIDSICATIAVASDKES